MTPDRRQFLSASLAAAATAGLAGCGASDTGPDLNSTQQPASVPVADVPEGGGVILKDASYVVVQPTKGEFKAFNSTCPHQGCKVSGIMNDQIVCGCHDSRFRLADGQVQQGPAKAGLGAATVTRNGDTLTVTG